MTLSSLFQKQSCLDVVSKMHPRFIPHLHRSPLQNEKQARRHHKKHKSGEEQGAKRKKLEKRATLAGCMQLSRRVPLLAHLCYVFCKSGGCLCISPGATGPIERGSGIEVDGGGSV